MPTLIELLVLLGAVFLAYRVLTRVLTKTGIEPTPVVAALIESRDVRLVEDRDREAIARYMIDVVIYERGADEEQAARIGKRLREVRQKAETTGVDTLSSQFEAIESMADRVADGFELLEDKTRSFAHQEGIRYSTVGVYVSRLEGEIKALKSAFPRLESLTDEMDLAVDEIIRSQDQGLVSVEFGGPAGQAAVLVEQVDRNIETVKSDLEITVKKIREVFEANEKAD